MYGMGWQLQPTSQEACVLDWQDAACGAPEHKWTYPPAAAPAAAPPSVTSTSTSTTKLAFGDDIVMLSSTIKWKII